MAARKRKQLPMFLLILCISAAESARSDALKESDDSKNSSSSHSFPPPPPMQTQPKKNQDDSATTVGNNTIITKPTASTPPSLDATTSGSGNESATTMTTTPEFPESKSDHDHCCETTKVFACLSSPGDASNGVLSLVIKSRDNVKVNIITPSFLSADPVEFTTDGKDDPVKIEMVDAEAAKLQTLSNITIKSEAEFCYVPVPSRNLGYSRKDLLPGFSLRTPIVGFSMLGVALMVVLGSWAYYRYYKGKARQAEGPKYVELEMGLDDHSSAVESSNQIQILSKSSPPPPLPASSHAAAAGGELNDDGWSEVWDEDWEEDSEKVGNSQFKLTESLSSKGLASRRTGKAD